MTPIFVVLRKLSCLIVLIVFTLLGTAASQPSHPIQGSVSVEGGGALSWYMYLNADAGSCPGGAGAYSVAEYYSFSYTSSAGVVTSFPHATEGYYWSYPCDSGEPAPPTPITMFGSMFAIAFAPGYYGSGTAIFSQGVQGILYPKYVVVGVTYAPPGDASGAVSTVQYTGTTSIGTTVTNSTSFANDVGYSVQIQDTGNIPTGTTGASGSVQLTKTNLRI